MDSRVLGLTADIVAAHLSRNNVDSDQLPELIRSVHSTLVQVDRAKSGVPVREPAVPLKRSVFSDHIVCLECGKSFRTLKRHLQVDHKLTKDEYLARYDLPREYPLVAPEYGEKRSEIAKKVGLGKRAIPKKQHRV